jgi:hypothetical protein
MGLEFVVCPISPISALPAIQVSGPENASGLLFGRSASLNSLTASMPASHSVRMPLGSSDSLNSSTVPVPAIHSVCMPLGRSSSLACTVNSEHEALQRLLPSPTSSQPVSTLTASAPTCTRNKPPLPRKCPSPRRQNKPLSLPNAGKLVAQSSIKKSSRKPTVRSYLQALTSSPLKNPSAPIIPPPQQAITSLEGRCFCCLSLTHCRKDCREPLRCKSCLQSWSSTLIYWATWRGTMKIILVFQ